MGRRGSKPLSFSPGYLDIRNVRQDLGLDSITDALTGRILRGESEGERIVSPEGVLNAHKQSLGTVESR